MNKVLGFFILISFSGFSQSRFDLDPKTSQIKWNGKYVIGPGHVGTIKPLAGSVLISSTGLISKGDFSIDMNTIHSIGEGNGGIEKLDDHLKSDDFFSTAQFPLTSFTIIEVRPSPNFLADQYVVVGSLTMKGTTNQITFPAIISVNDRVARMKADIIINRTKWGIIYQSSSFFAILKDDVISDDFKVSIDLRLLKIMTYKESLERHQ